MVLKVCPFFRPFWGEITRVYFPFLDIKNTMNLDIICRLNLNQNGYNRITHYDIYKEN